MSQTAVMTLTEFLAARLDEDEAVARAALARYDGTPTDGVWSTGSHAMDECRIDGDAFTIYDEGGHSAEQAGHIARHDPARVLREVEAKRRVVERHSDCGTGHGYCDDGGHGWDWSDGMLGCADLADLATVYADHPDHRDEWRP